MKNSKEIEKEIETLTARLMKAREELASAKKSELAAVRKARVKKLERAGFLDLTDQEIEHVISQLTRDRGHS